MEERKGARVITGLGCSSWHVPSFSRWIEVKLGVWLIICEWLVVGKGKGKGIAYRSDEGD